MSWCFLVNGNSFIAVIVSLLVMRVPPHIALNWFEKPLKQFAEGLRYASRQREILGLLLLAFALGFGFMIQANSMNSMLQLKVEDQMPGRVMSLYTLSFFSSVTIIEVSTNYWKG